MTQAFALDGGRRAHTLVPIEETVGKHMIIRTHLQPSIRGGVDFDVLAAQLFAYIIAFQNELLSVTAHGKWLTHMALLTLAQHVVRSPGVSRFGGMSAVAAACV